MTAHQPHPSGDRAATERQHSAASYSQFVEAPPTYLHVNRLVDALELYKIFEAGDGQRFDQHFAAMLRNNTDPAYGSEPYLLSSIERAHGAPCRYAPSQASARPHSFAVLRQLADELGKEPFVAAVMAPSRVRLPPTCRPGVAAQQEHLSAPSIQQQFAGDHCAALGQLFSQPLLDEIAAQVEQARFGAMQHSKLGVDYTMDFGPTQLLLHALISDRRIVSACEQLAGLTAGSIRFFSGRIYRMIPGRDSDSYHNDVHHTDNRLLAISVALSRAPCGGGALLLRRRGLRRPFAVAPVPALGHATVFRLSRHLQHKVANVTSGARTNLAGWLCADPAFAYDSWVDAPLFAAAPSAPLARAARWLWARR